MRILFNFTTRYRRDGFLRGIDSIVNNLANKEDYHILISVENAFHDHKMHPLPVLNYNHTYCVNPNAPTTKVDAINRDVNEFDYDWDILVNMSDDVVFVTHGFDDIIRSQFTNSDQVLHFPDGNRTDLLTVSIIGRVYYNRDKYIYHPSYKSLYCDNEVMEVARMRGCYKYVDCTIFNHLHPAYGKGRMDNQYIETESFGSEDCQTYLKRREHNFYEA